MLKKMHALQRAERGRCGSAWPCHMLSFPKFRKTHVTQKQHEAFCLHLASLATLSLQCRKSGQPFRQGMLGMQR